MKYSPSTASSTNPWNTSGLGRMQINLLPRILVASDDNAWVISVNEKKRFLGILVSEKPCVHCVKLRKPERVERTDQSSKVRLKYGFVAFETYIERSALSLFVEHDEKRRKVVKVVEHVLELFARCKNVSQSMPPSSKCIPGSACSLNPRRLGRRSKDGYSEDSGMTEPGGNADIVQSVQNK